MSSVPNDLIELGRVVSAYGVPGWVKIQPYAAGGDTLLAVKQWWLKAPVPPSGSGVSSSPVLYQVSQSRAHSGTVVALFNDFNNRNQAEPLKAYTVWVSRALFPSATDNEYYWADLIDCQFYGVDAQGNSELFGRVATVFDNGAHAILEIELGHYDDTHQFQAQTNARGRPLTALVPFVADRVHTVELDTKKIYSDWPSDAL